MACVTSFESHFAALCIELTNSGNEDFISKILPLFNGTLINSNPESVDKGRTNIVLLLYSKIFQIVIVEYAAFKTTNSKIRK